MRTSQWGLALLLGATAPLAFASHSSATAPDQLLTRSLQVGARIWLEAEPDYYRRGDRLNVRFSVPRNSYVAIVHIDSDGQLDFLYPANPWDSQYVRGGQVHALPIRGSFASSTIRSRPGIGYVYLIASPTPLDFRHFQGGIGASWSWGYAGQSVYGDPFLAFEQITRLLLPGWPYSQYVYDYHGYYVEGIHRYPSYACSDRYYDYGWGLNSAFGSCSRLDGFLRQNPYYYDTRRFAGDRRVYLRQYDRLDPRHGFKESPDGVSGFGSRAPAPAIRPPANDPGREVPRRDPIPVQSAPRGTEPPRAPASTPRGVEPQRTPVPATREPAQRPAPEAQPQPSATGRQPAPERQPAPASTGRDRPVPETGRGVGR